MVVMAEKRPLYAQLPDMPAGKVLEDVFAQAAGFSQTNQSDEYFIPEMSRAEAVLFPNDSPMALGKMASQRRLSPDNGADRVFAFRVNRKTVEYHAAQALGEDLCAASCDYEGYYNQLHQAISEEGVCAINAMHEGYCTSPIAASQWASQAPRWISADNTPHRGDQRGSTGSSEWRVSGTLCCLRQKTEM